MLTKNPGRDARGLGDITLHRLESLCHQSEPLMNRLESLCHQS